MMARAWDAPRTEVPVFAVVPAYDAARTVGTVVRELVRSWPHRRANENAVIVVDDGSTDGTPEVAESAGATVVRHAKNAGKGAALRTGFEHARRLGATLVVTVDADGQHPVEEALRLALAPEPREALVLGARDLVRDGAPRPNRFSNGISNMFLSWFTRRRLHDTQCGLRRYPLPESLELGAKDDGYAFEAEFILRAAHANWNIVEVPVRVHYPPESERTTHFDSVKDPARIVYRVLATLAERARG
jgi:glycosyltransferase involved in cell wall biosynthesis